MCDELTLDDIRNDATGLYFVAVHCAECNELILKGKEMTGVHMAKNWLLIVASSPLATSRCPKGCEPTYSDCNAHTKLKIRKVDDTAKTP